MKDASLIDDATAWRGADFQKARSWVCALDNIMRDEIVEATKALVQTDVQIVGKANFSLPVTSAVLRSAYDELEFGRGPARIPTRHKHFEAPRT